MFTDKRSIKSESIIFWLDFLSDTAIHKTWKDCSSKKKVLGKIVMQMKKMMRALNLGTRTSEVLLFSTTIVVFR